MSGAFECATQYTMTPEFPPSSTSNERRTESRVFTDATRSNTNKSSASTRRTNWKWNGLLSKSSTSVLPTLALIALIPLTLIIQSSEAELRIVNEFSDPEMDMFQRRVERGENFRPLQFGKRDSTFRPLQFGKKNDFRPLQFGKRTPPTMHKKFYGLPDNTNNVFSRHFAEETQRPHLGPGSILAEKMFPTYGNHQRLYNTSPYH